MELELDLKLARVADEFNLADLHIAKDRDGPLFISSETESLFILTAHLRGYKTKNVKIEINEDKRELIINGEKSIEENVFIGRKLYKKETEIKNFKKTFKIPNGVILNKIEAKFDNDKDNDEDDESMLTVSMPKKEKRISGFTIKEVEEQAIIPSPRRRRRRSSETLQVVLDDPKQELNYTKSLQNVEKLDDIITEKHKNDHGDHIQEKSTEIIQSQIKEQEDEIIKQEFHEKVEDEVKSAENEEEKERSLSNKEEKGSFKICVPAMAGSAFLLSLIVFVIHYVKTKSQSEASTRIG